MAEDIKKWDTRTHLIIDILDRYELDLSDGYCFYTDDYEAKLKEIAEAILKALN
jgi:hypothetical protein